MLADSGGELGGGDAGGTDCGGNEAEAMGGFGRRKMKHGAGYSLGPADGKVKLCAHKNGKLWEWMKCY